MAQISRIGFGQVEPNLLVGIVDGNILAQLPVNREVLGDVIEQGRFVKYDYANHEVNLTGAGKWMLVYNEEEFYDERDYGHRAFALKAEDRFDGIIVPRLIMPYAGDVMTTNNFLGADDEIPATKRDTVEGIELAEGDNVGVNPATGYLTNEGYDENGPVYEVAKVYTMPDGQPGVKLHCIKA